MSNPYAPPPPGSRPKTPGTGQEPGGPRPSRGGPPRPAAEPPRPAPETPLPPAEVASRPQRRGAPRGPSGPAHPAPSDGAPQIPADVALAVRRVRGFGALSLGAILATALPLPWQVLGTVVCLAALVSGISALRAVIRSSARRRLLPVVTVGLAVCAVFLVSSLSVIATWPIQQARQDCLDRAITLSAREQCEAEYRQSVEERLSPSEP